MSSNLTPLCTFAVSPEKCYIIFINAIKTGYIKMKLFTEIINKKNEKLFGKNAVVTGIGSCFSQYVMEQLASAGFDSAHNPNGIVYNSHSIVNSLERIINKSNYKKEDFLFHDNLWHSWEHHGSFSHQSQETLKETIKKSANNFYNKLVMSDIFMLTPSSSVVYCLKENNRLVANCHKYPGNKFHTVILSPEENYKNLKKALELIRLVNTKCSIIITLSPVRHYPGDLVLNARSKANLLYAIHKVVEESENAAYFPSYEILLDELRDYRFFNEDMLHPSELARKIIFDRFVDTFFDEKCKKEICESFKNNKKMQHRQLNADYL